METETRIFDLLEKYSFEQLSEQDNIFVLSEMSKEEYDFQREIMLGAAELDYNIPKPLPFAAPLARVVFWKRPIPLYQVSVAAALIFGFFLFTRNEEERKNTDVSFGALVSLNNNFISRTDTVFDTITQFSPMITLIHDTVYLKEFLTEYVVESENNALSRPLASLESTAFPNLVSSFGPVKNASLKGDETAHLIPKALSFGQD